jgi:hypothetical protein
MRLFALLGAALFALVALRADAAGPAGPGLVSLTRQFADFADATRLLPEAERVRRFRAEFGRLFPGFYTPRNGLSDAEYDARLVRALQRFPERRADYERVEREFPAAYAAGMRKFRARFPDFRPASSVYLLHSLGEMDGGTRTIGGRNYLIFGADVIARVHGPKTFEPFLDHELFHVQNGRSFADCEPLWCSLWTEGLATYAAWVMNPGATDRQLLLELPRPMRPEVEADWRRAFCLIHARRNSEAPADYRMFFTGAAAPDGLPPRYGYYVGLKLMKRSGRGHDLARLARLDQLAARRLLEAELARTAAEAGGCVAG